MFSHGWCSLPPFTVEEDPLTLRIAACSSHGKGYHVVLREKPRSYSPSVQIETSGRVSEAVRTEAGTITRDILQFDADLQEFYAFIANFPHHVWMKQEGVGRFLRAPTFFEDLIKTICTTNCSWSFTTTMTNHLVNLLGQTSYQSRHIFPTPESIADQSEVYLRKECKLGYRAPYILELSRRAASGELDIEAFRKTSAPADEVFAELTALKGIGDYAAANLLRMLGKFDYLGLDSWCRKKIAEIHGDGTTLSDSDIKRLYAPYGKWKGLVMWSEVTRSWYSDKFPQW